MSGGVDSSVTAALLKAEGYDVVGVTLQLYDHGAATHRKGACCAGRDIHDARAVAERIGIPHYVLDYESRFKEMVIDRFAESYVRGRDAGAVRRLQHVDQVSRPARHRARPRRQGAGHRPLRRLARTAGRRPRALPGARGGARPELFPVCHHARAARFPALSPGRVQQVRDPRTRAPLRPVGRRQAGQPGHLFRAVRQVHRGDRASQARRRRTRRHRRCLRQGAGASSRHHSFHRRPAPRPRHRRRSSALRGARWRRPRGVLWSVRGKCCGPSA